VRKLIFLLLFCFVNIEASKLNDVIQDIKGRKFIVLSDKVRFVYKNYTVNKVYDKNSSVLKIIEFIYNPKFKNTITMEGNNIILKEGPLDYKRENIRRVFKDNRIIARYAYDNEGILIGESHYKSVEDTWGIKSVKIMHEGYFKDGSLKYKIFFKKNKSIKSITYFKNGDYTVRPLDKNEKVHGQIEFFDKDDKLKIRSMYFSHGEKLNLIESTFVGLKDKLFTFFK